MVTKLIERKVEDIKDIKIGDAIDFFHPEFRTFSTQRVIKIFPRKKKVKVVDAHHIHLIIPLTDIKKVYKVYLVCPKCKKVINLSRPFTKEEKEEIKNDGLELARGGGYAGITKDNIVMCFACL